MITGLAHVCFIVSDLEASIGFYRDVLGMTEAFDFVRDTGERYGVYLYAGERSFIELFAGEPQAAADSASYKHLCLEVDNLAATVADLRSKGAEVAEPKLGNDRSWQAWLDDPDGNRIELHQYTPESKQMRSLK